MKISPVVMVTGKPDVASVFFQADDEAGAGDRADHGADAAEKRHQDHLARHLPGDVGEGGELEDDRLEGARPAAAVPQPSAATRWPSPTSLSASFSGASPIRRVALGIS